MKEKHSLLILTYISAPYRVEVFNELGKYYDVTVLFERNNDFNRPKEWFPKKFENFIGHLLCDDSQKTKQEIKNIEKRMYSKEYDLVILYEYSTPKAIEYAIICQILEIPYFINCDGSFINKNFIKGLIKRFSIRSASGYFASGKMASGYLEYFGAKKDIIHYHPFTSLYCKDIFSNVCDQQEKQQLRSELKLTGNKIAITVGRFIPSKRIDVLINAWARFSDDFQLIIAGSGDLEFEYLNQINRLNLHNIILPGFLEKEILFKYLRASDLFVLPTETDTWGLVINEAMACGLPVVTTKMCIAGIELVRDWENGFLVPVGDSNALFDVMNNILTDDNLRLRMAKNALKTIQPYTYENVAKSHINSIEGFLRNNRS